MTQEKLIDQIVARVGGHLHAEQLIDAGRAMAEFAGANPRQVDSRDTALEYCNSLLFSLLNSNRYAKAASLLWTPIQFNPAPRATQMVWEGLQTSNSLMLMGSASQSKSYSAGVWFMLDWLRDPEYTSVNLVGPSEDHLKDNLFSHLVALHSSATLPMPGFVGDLFIGLDSKNRRGAIRGIVIPIGKKPSGRLQGRKRVPRKTAHPSLGQLSRIRFFIDEVEKVPAGIWKDVDNIFSNLGSDVDGFKIACAFNPEDPNGPVAQRCEPVNGWEEFKIEEDEKWRSKRGWDVVRLDAAKSENVIQQKEIYPGLQTFEGYNRIIENAGGVDTPGYYTMARAAFPPGGAVYSVMPPLLVGRMRAEFIFAETPENAAAVDLALEGKDSAEMATGRFGRAVGVRYRPSFDFPNGREILFADRSGQRVFRWALQVDKIFPLPKGATVAMADKIQLECTRLHIPPGHVMVDRTGNGAGVHDYLKSSWSEEVRGVNYQESATEKKILVEDTKTAKEEYGRAVSELWFAMKKWAEFNFLKVSADALSETLVKELTGRRYAAGKNTMVETKDEYKSRGNNSPNKADALTLLVHSVRLFSGCIPSTSEDLEGTTTTVGAGSSGRSTRVPVFEDVSNQAEALDDKFADDYLN